MNLFIVLFLCHLHPYLLDCLMSDDVNTGQLFETFQK